MNFNFKKEIILENERVRLTPLALDHYRDLLPVATAVSDLVKFSPSQIHTPQHLRQYIEIAMDNRKKHVRYAFAVFDKATDRLAGSTSFGNIYNHDSRMEIGWTWIGKEFQQTGLNRNMKFLMLHYAFDTIGAVRLEFRTDERNLQSRTAIEKIGGRFEGVLRSHMLMPDGFRRNTACYSILKTEWENIKNSFFKNNA